MHKTEKGDKRKLIDLYPIPTVCPYCGQNVIFTSNAELYGKEHGNGKCYKCTHCDASVGVHNGTHIPLGRLANPRLKMLKRRCHQEFDNLWKSASDRDIAYKWLATELGVPANKCHFGWFDEEILEKALEILKERKNMERCA